MSEQKIGASDPGAFDDLDDEQSHLKFSHDSLDTMRHRAEQLLDDVRRAGAPDPDYEAALVRRVGVLSDSRRPLLFGRIDESSGDSYHVGRRHVEDPLGEPVVLDWRAPVSTAFYRARPGDPLGLVRRRQIMVEGRRVLVIADDHVGGQPGEEGATTLRGGDALLAELERSRTGEMLDIVSTIQLEQDEVIRAPLEGIIAVQGGPGTGKTAIGLHRAAFLLYNHPELAREGILVVGPSRAFLRYIAQVLPSLGEEAVVQTTLRDLVPKVRTARQLDDGPARVKGDARMTAVLRQGLAARRARADDDLAVAIGLGRVVLRRDAINSLVDTLATRQGPYRAGRTALRTRLAGLVRGELAQSGVEIDEGRLRRELSRDGGLVPLVDRLWPSVSAPQFVAELLSSPGALARAAAGILTAEEQAIILHPGQRGRPGFELSDLALVDEVAYLLDGQAHVFGHVVVDEVQDLSPMQLRMLARRAPSGSMTVLGDLAQATSVASCASWEEILDNLPAPAGLRRTELTLGYRAPGLVLELASRLLSEAAPGISPTRSVRPGRSAPLFLHVAPVELVAAAAAEAARLVADEMLVGVIAADAALGPLHEALRRSGVDAGFVERDGLGHAVVIAGAGAAKGLEFDAVVVLEPAAIAEGGMRGLRMLYVALTRAVQHLSIVHAAPLPSALATEP